MIEPEFNNAQRLGAAGFSPDQLVEVAKEAARIYERNRKSKGQRDGPLGVTGLVIYEAMLRDEDYEPDPSALTAYRSHSAEDVGKRVLMSRGAVGSAVNRLIDQGFLIKQRDGRQFQVKCVIPTAALVELATYWSALEDGPDTYSGGILKPMGQRLATLYPTETD